MTKYLVICGSLLKNSCFAFCNASPKYESGLREIRKQEIILRTTLSLTNK